MIYGQPGLPLKMSIGCASFGCVCHTAAYAASGRVCLTAAFAISGRSVQKQSLLPGSIHSKEAGAPLAVSLHSSLCCPWTGRVFVLYSSLYPGVFWPAVWTLDCSTGDYQ